MAKIRRVNSNDNWRDIGGVYVDSWRSAYSGLVPQNYLDGLTADHWAEPPTLDGYQAFVAEDQGRYVGVATTCPARDSAMQGWGELVSLYLLPDYFGCGLGTALLRAAERGLEEMGYNRWYLWVLEANGRARRFYENHGFHCDGGRMEIAVGGAQLVEIRYVGVI